MNETQQDDRGRIWLRAAILGPLAILGMAVIAGEGGYAAIPFDAVSAGNARGRMLWFMTLEMLAMFAFGFCSLMLFVMGFLHGAAVLRGRNRVRTVAMTLLLLGAYGLFRHVDGVVASEIAAAGKSLLVEVIPASHWQVEICGRHGAVCIDWQGKLGKARVRQPVGASDRTKGEWERWRAVHTAGQSLQVEWAMTPGGWIAARSAQAGQLRAANPWR